jgi:hypothetical protein
MIQPFAGAAEEARIMNVLTGVAGVLELNGPTQSAQRGLITVSGRLITVGAGDRAAGL